MQKQRLFYSLPLIDRFGHLSHELFYLQNLYPMKDHEYNIFIPPLSKRPRTNIFMFNKVTKGMNVIETEDEDILWAAYRKKDNVLAEERNGDLYVLLDGSQIHFEYLQRFKNKSPNFFYVLDEEERSQGLELKRKLGIPDQAPTVTLHVRDRGFLPDLNYHSFRDANIDNYIPAIEYLLSLGIFVVRIGDPSMKKIGGLPANFIDAPFHSAYSNLIEPYFIGTSLFHFCVISGPCSAAISFQKPILYTNTQLSYSEWGSSDDLIMPKKFYSHKLNRFLTYEEIVCSPLTDFWDSKHFEEVGVQLVENSPKELLEAAKEMLQRLCKQYGKESEIEKLNLRVDEIKKRGNHHRQMNNAQPPFYGAHISNLKICHSFTELNPWFLGHDYSESTLKL